MKSSSLELLEKILAYLTTTELTTEMTTDTSQHALCHSFKVPLW